MIYLSQRCRRSVALKIYLVLSAIFLFSAVIPCLSVSPNSISLRDRSTKNAFKKLDKISKRQERLNSRFIKKYFKYENRVFRQQCNHNEPYANLYFSFSYFPAFYHQKDLYLFCKKYYRFSKSTITTSADTLHAILSHDNQFLKKENDQLLKESRQLILNNYWASREKAELYQKVAKCRLYSKKLDRRGRNKGKISTRVPTQFSVDEYTRACNYNLNSDWLSYHKIIKAIRCQNLDYSALKLTQLSNVSTTIVNGNSQQLNVSLPVEIGTAKLSQTTTLTFLENKGGQFDNGTSNYLSSKEAAIVSSFIEESNISNTDCRPQSMPFRSRVKFGTSFSIEKNSDLSINKLNLNVELNFIFTPRISFGSDITTSISIFKKWGHIELNNRFEGPSLFMLYNVRWNFQIINGYKFIELDKLRAGKEIISGTIANYNPYYTGIRYKGRERLNGNSFVQLVISYDLPQLSLGVNNLELRYGIIF